MRPPEEGLLPTPGVYFSSLVATRVLDRTDLAPRSAYDRSPRFLRQDELP